MGRENFFNKAKADGQVFVRTIGLMTKLGKLKLDIRSKQREQAKLYKLVGAATYEVSLLEEIPYDRFFIDSVVDYLESLIELDQEIADLHEQMEQARRDFRGELEPKKISDQRGQPGQQGYTQQGQPPSQYSDYMQPSHQTPTPPVPQAHGYPTPPMPQGYDPQQQDTPQQDGQQSQQGAQPPQIYTPIGQPQKTQSSSLMDQIQSQQGRSSSGPSKKKKQGDKPLSRSGDPDDEDY